jgi:hypothetical protein
MSSQNFQNVQTKIGLNKIIKLPTPLCARIGGQATPSKSHKANTAHAASSLYQVFLSTEGCAPACSVTQFNDLRNPPPSIECKEQRFCPQGRGYCQPLDLSLYKGERHPVFSNQTFLNLSQKQSTLLRLPRMCRNLPLGKPLRHPT